MQKISRKSSYNPVILRITDIVTAYWESDTKRKRRPVVCSTTGVSWLWTIVTISTSTEASGHMEPDCTSSIVSSWGHHMQRQQSLADWLTSSSGHAVNGLHMFWDIHPQVLTINIRAPSKGFAECNPFCSSAVISEYDWCSIHTSSIHIQPNKKLSSEVCALPLICANRNSSELHLARIGLHKVC